MPANRRISQYYQDKKVKRGQYPKFVPDLEEWKEACRIYCYDYQIAKHFDISKECFYKFIDRQRHEKEQKGPAEFLDAYIKERTGTKKKILNKLLDTADKGDMAALIFSAKTYGGLKEKKDEDFLVIKKKELELKQKEMMLKQKEFIAKIAERYQLDFSELKEFADRYFEGEKVDEL